MADQKTELIEQIENVFKEIGGFSWEQVETWASFCLAVGMDPLPQLQVMMNNLCEVISPSDRSTPDKANSPELWIERKGRKVRFKIVGPF